MSNVVSDIGHAISNPANLIGTSLGFGVGGAGGLTGGNVAGNIATGQPFSTNLRGAAFGDLAGLGAGFGAAGAMGGSGSGAWTAIDPYTGFPMDYGGGEFAGLGMDAGADAASAGVMGGSPYGSVVGEGAAGGGLGGYGGLIGPGINAANRLLGGGGGGNSFMNFLTGQGGGPSLPSLAPGLAALQYARQQTPVDTSQLQGVFNSAGANAPLFVQASQDPLKQAQAGGYGDILQSQAQRGIRGSSFGDQDIANYLTDTNRGIADAGINAAQASLGLQGRLAGQISNLNALSQQMKNNLYGRAFSSLGQGLNPIPGMGGQQQPSRGGGPNIGGTLSGAGGFIGNLGLGGVGNAFGNLLGSAGKGMGNLFGNPGSTFWGGPVDPPIQGMPTDYLGDLAGF